MINIYQIYYDEISKNNCYPEYNLYYNPHCTPFFENSVILELVGNEKHCDGDYFGVWSHKFREKVDPRQKFTPKIFERFIKSHPADLYSAHKYHSAHVPVKLAEKYHPNFSYIMQLILDKISYRADFNEKARFVIYSNHFIASPCVYQDYVDTLLRPAMEVMSNDEEVKSHVWKNARYRGHGNLPDHLKPLFGVDFYPYHTFLCERLIMLYLNNNRDIKCMNL